MAWMRMMGAESVAYHRETVIGRADDHPGLGLAYYASRGETPLAWGGAGARAFGLAGPVTDAQYDNVFGPGGFRDPTTGTRLVETRRPGLELVVSAHKSVALLGVLGWADEMHALLDAETDATLGYLDDIVRSTGGRRGRAQTRTPTSGLLWARTRHATSRAGDPEPHDHVLIANMVEMRDERGGRKALDTALIRDHLHAATMVGRVASARKAVEMGFAITPDRGPSGKLGHWRIAGIPQDACALFSKRSAEIDQAMSAAGFDTYQGRQVAARGTRRAKRHTSPDELLPRWTAELERAGLGLQQLQDQVVETARAHIVQPAPDAAEVDRLAGEALAREGRLAQVKVFTRADVMVAVAPSLYGQDLGQLDRVVDRVIRHPDAIPLVGVPNAREQAYAPACVVAVEAAIASLMEEGAARSEAPRVPYPMVERYVWAKERVLGGPLTVGQTDAAVRLCTSGHGTELVVGVAGAGKTAMLDVVRAGFESEGFRVIGTATSGQAARTLGRDAGLTESRTVASLLWRLNRGRVSLDASTVLIVDEAAMTDDPALLRLLAEANAAGAKTILVGDHRQLGAVGPSGALEGLFVRHRDAVHVLRENVRQHDVAERAMLAQLRAGDVSKAVDWCAEHGRIVVAPTRGVLLPALVDGWHADVASGRETSMFAWRRANVAELNRLARQRWDEEGHLSGPELAVAGGRRYAAGDRVITLAPSADGQLVTSEHGVVEAVHLAEDELVLRMDDHRLVRVPAEDAGPDRLDYGYAITVHRSQGGTVDTGHRLADGGGRELGYVSMSRARERSTVYVVADDLEQACGDLTQDWAAERRQRWAIDTGTPTIAVQDIERDDAAPTRLQETIRRARLESERQALADAIPPDVTAELRRERYQLAWLDQDRNELERGTGRHRPTDAGRAAWRREVAAGDLARAERAAEDPRLRRSDRRSAREQIKVLRAEVDAALEQWNKVGAPVAADLDAQIVQATSVLDRLTARQHERSDWLDRHPEALNRLGRLDRELAELRPERSLTEPLVAGLDPPHLGLHPQVPEYDFGPELGF